MNARKSVSAIALLLGLSALPLSAATTYQPQVLPFMVTGPNIFTVVSITNPCNKAVDVAIHVYNQAGDSYLNDTEHLRPYGQWKRRLDGDANIAFLSGTVEESGPKHCTVDIEGEQNVLEGEHVHTVNNVGVKLSEVLMRPSRYSTAVSPDPAALFMAINYSGESQTICFCDHLVTVQESCPHWNDYVMAPHQLIAAPINPALQLSVHDHERRDQRWSHPFHSRAYENVQRRFYD